MIRKLAACALAAALACSAAGCAVLAPRDSTVVLPTLPPQTVPEQESGAAFSVQHMNQYTLTTSCVDLSRLTPCVGWSSGSLYIVDGAPGETVTVRRVDPRYGFFEDCADLGVLNYNNLTLSDDGRYVVYDVTTQDERLELHCFTVASGEDRVVADYPNPGPWLGVQIAWAEGGSSFFYWFASNDNARVWEAESEKYTDSFYDPMAMFDALEAEGFPFNQVLRVDARTGSRSVALTIDEMACTREYAECTGGMEAAYDKDVWVSPDGTRLLAYYWLEGIQTRWLLAQDGQVQQAQSRFIEEQLALGGGILQLADEGLLGETMQMDEAKEWTRVPFLCRDGSSAVCFWGLSESAYVNMQVNSTVYYVGLNESPFVNMQLTPDETHLLVAQSGSAGETAVWVYELDETGQPRMESGQLLYQSVQEVRSVWLSPDQTRAVIIAYSGYATATDGGPDSNPRYTFTVTVLEM